MNLNALHPSKIILDTDIGSDCDDAGALATLHALADEGEAEILACIYSSGINPYGPGCIAAINAHYGRPDIPIGAAEESDIGDPCSSYLEKIATNRALYGHKIVRREDVSDLVDVYRRTLAAAPDGSVSIVSIGHTKGLFDLLKSAPDAASALNGHELVACKVKTWIAMAGEFPYESKAGWNFGRNGAALYSRYVVENWPTPIVFSGYEIGRVLKTGFSLHATPECNPVRETYRLWNNNALENGRESWDQTAVLYAARGLGAYWDLCKGRCAVDGTGRTEWHVDEQGNHAYLVEKMSPAVLTEVIEDLMCRVPSA